MSIAKLGTWRDQAERVRRPEAKFANGARAQNCALRYQASKYYVQSHQITICVRGFWLLKGHRGEPGLQVLHKIYWFCRLHESRDESTHLR